MKVHAGQILPCVRVTGNKEFTIGGLISTLPESHVVLNSTIQRVRIGPNPTF